MNKTRLITLAALALLSAGCGDMAARAKEKEANPAFMFWCFRKEIVSSEYRIPDMATPASAAHLQNVLKNVPGYEDSSYDLPGRTMTVSYRSSMVRKMNFEEAIALAGFSVNARPANPSAKIPEGVK